ncbi:MAG: hypothetical protein AABX90_01155, partial [Nanoarchaeota archaeon]
REQQIVPSSENCAVPCSTFTNPTNCVNAKFNNVNYCKIVQDISKANICSGELRTFKECIFDPSVNNLQNFKNQFELEFRFDVFNELSPNTFLPSPNRHTIKKIVTINQDGNPTIDGERLGSLGQNNQNCGYYKYELVYEYDTIECIETPGGNYFGYDCTRGIVGTARENFAYGIAYLNSHQGNAVKIDNGGRYEEGYLAYKNLVLD